MSTYSFSQIGTYQQCGLKYRYQYVDGIKTDFVETAEVMLGQIVHKALEALYEQVNIGKIPELDQVMDTYRGLWQEKRDAYDDYIPMVGAGTLDDVIQRGKGYIEEYYEKHAPFADVKVVATEGMFSFMLHDDIKLRGVVDRLDKVGDTFVINDYKTTKNLPTNDKDEYKDQLTLYGLGIMEKYGTYFDTLKAKLHLLHFDLEDERDVTQQLLQQTKEKYVGLITEIEHKKKQYATGDKKVFAPQPSPLCRFCPFQSICPEFTYVGEDDSLVSELGERSLATLIDELADVKAQLSELKKREDGLKQDLITYIEQKYPALDQSTYKIPGSTKDVKISLSDSYKAIDKAQFMQKVKELGLFDTYAEIPYYAMNKMFTDEPVTITDFDGSVKEDISYKVSIVQKKRET